MLATGDANEKPKEGSDLCLRVLLPPQIARTVGMPWPKGHLDGIFVRSYAAT